MSEGRHEFGSALSKRNQALNQSEDMVAQRRALHAAIALQPGEHVLDVGCGSGILAAELASRLTSGHLWAIDKSPDMVALTRTQLAEYDVADRADVRQGMAEDLPLEDSSIDVAVVVQVCLYLDSISPLLRELRRVLRRPGRLVILETDWDSLVWHTTQPDQMERIVTHYHRTAFADAHVPRTLPRELRAAGFTFDGCEVFPVLNMGTNRNTYSRHMIGIISSKVGSNHSDMEEWQANLEGLGEDYFFSLNRYIFRASQ